MENGFQRTDLLPGTWPAIAILFFAAVALFVWFGLHGLRRFLPDAWYVSVPLLILRTISAYTAFWLCLNLLARVIDLETTWPLWVICLLSAAAFEAILGLYCLERRTVRRGVGMLLVGLRAALVLLVGLMLAQPVLSWSFTQQRDRVIAILIDESASMQTRDLMLTPSEKLSLIEALTPDVVARPYELDRPLPELAEANRQLRALINAIENRTSTKSKATSNSASDASLQDILKIVEKQVARLNGLLELDIDLSEKTRAAAEKLQRQLADRAAAQIAQAEKSIRNDSASSTVVIKQLTEVADTINLTMKQLPPIQVEADRRYYQALQRAKREAVNETAGRSRLELARLLLIGASDAKRGLISQLRENFTVKVYRFAQDTGLAQTSAWLPASDESVAAESSLEGDAEPAAARPPEQMTTDLYTALDTLRRETAADELKGILLITDGRHNAEGDLGAAAADLANRGVPLAVIPIGSSRSPTGAVLVDVDSPKTILVDDELSIKARVKITQLRGKSISVKLLDGERTVDERMINVDQDAVIKSVTLTDMPHEEGVRRYTVKVTPVETAGDTDGELVEDSSREVTVAVTDQRMQMLLVEGHPRWEYRYLRNLFSSRDEFVQLQVVLLAPDRIAGLPGLPAIPASVTRAAQSVEATMLPTSEEEWMKFDIILLGDVHPGVLSGAQIEALQRFVTDRGGTLVVIAGPHYMPHAYRHSVLADLLPITFKPRASAELPGPEGRFWIAPTQVGLRHPIMQQSDDMLRSRGVWRSFPEIDWRHPITGVKQGAAVLAYAKTPISEDRMRNVTDPDERLALREKYEKENALIVTQRVGAGRVLMMNFDRTWRMRYRTGDKHHHRFWGQVFRWAEADRLQSGNSFVRLGTNRTSYASTEPVIVRARITDIFQKPIVDEEAAVKVYQGDTLVMTKKLRYLLKSQGMYEANLGQMPADGVFRVELHSLQAAQILAGTSAETVSTTITVDPTAQQSVELAEVTTDRKTLANLAQRSGGAVAEVNRAEALFELFGPGTERIVDKHRLFLWDSWPLLVLMLLALTTEWFVRKKVGLT